MADITDLLARKQPTIAKVPIDIGDGEQVEFVFRALSREDYENLRDAEENQPTAQQNLDYANEQRAEGVKNPTKHMWNPDTFPPALLAACAVDPAMTVEQATALWNSDRFSPAELGTLFGSAHSINVVNPLAAGVRLGNV